MATTRTAIAPVHETCGPTRAAMFCGIEELLLRAGARSSDFREWRVDWSEADHVTLYLKPGTLKRIRFARCRPDAWRSIASGSFHISRASWMTGAERTPALIPDFHVPFSTSPADSLGPLFRFEDPSTIECPVDLPLATLLTLCRFEETFPGPRDLHGRFPASASVAARGGFLERPIVDEWGYALEQCLVQLLPGWQPVERRFRVKLGHDVDEIGLPFSLRGAAGLALRDRRPLGALRDVASSLVGVETTYLRQLRRLLRYSAEHRIDSAVYWKSSKSGPFDTGYDLRDPRLSRLIADFRSQGVEIGVHPSYETFSSHSLLREEVGHLREILRDQSLGGRQDFLRWSPHSWLLWDDLRLAYDSSVGFADHIGFRAGTSFPFRPWLWAAGRRASLLEIPLLAMDSTLLSYMRLAPDEILRRVRLLISRCRLFGGVFTLAWHNTRILDPAFSALYRAVLNDLHASAKFDWRPPLI